MSDVRTAIQALGISVVEKPDAATTALDRDGIAYAPLEAISPDLLRVLRLRDVLGRRKQRFLNHALISHGDGSMLRDNSTQQC